MKLALMAGMLILSSCGAFRSIEALNQQEREIASITIEKILAEKASVRDGIDEKLYSLHCYYVLGQKNLTQFDASLKDHKLPELYQTPSYLGLLAIRTQVDELESDLQEFPDRDVLGRRIEDFAKRSPMAWLSMDNLASQLELSLSPLKEKITASELEKELSLLEDNREFQVYDKNIEHLSHIMDVRIKNETRKFQPSTEEQGNVTGQEFPAKVWALTFSKGPQVEFTGNVLKELSARGLKATFFQIGKKADQDLSQSRALIQAGMEIGGHSFSHQELSKVGGLTLEREISAATQQMEKDLKINLKLFRLPYGAGVDVPTIRKLMTENNLIHVLWNIDSLDWMAQSPDRIVQRTRELMKKTERDSGIILFHDNHQRSVAAAKEIMQDLTLDQRKVCTVGNIISDMNEGSKEVCSKN